MGKGGRNLPEKWVPIFEREWEEMNSAKGGREWPVIDNVK